MTIMALHKFVPIRAKAQPRLMAITIVSMLLQNPNCMPSMFQSNSTKQASQRATNLLNESKSGNTLEFT